MSFEKTITRCLTEEKWRLLRRALESRINEIYTFRQLHRESDELVRECDAEMELCYELMDEIKVK